MAGSILQRRISKAGLGRQTAKGTAAAAATYAFGVDGGSIFKLDLMEDEIPLTWSNLDILGYDRKGVKPGQSFGTVLTPNLAGLLLLGALGADAAAATTVTVTNVTATVNPTITTGTPHNLAVGQQVTISGVGGATTVNGTFNVLAVPTSTTFTITLTPAPAAYTSGGTVTTGYTHTITPAAVLPYLTGFGTFGAVDFSQVVDSKVSSLELSWENAGRVTAKTELLGCGAAMLAAAYIETNQELVSQVGYFTAGGGTFAIEGNDYAVTGGSVKIDTHIDQPISAATVLPPDVIEGKREITWSLKILVTDTGLFRETYFGSNAAGALSTISPFPHLGEVSTSFTGPGGNTLTLDSTKVRFAVQFPESSPDGGPAELTLGGTSTLPTSGSSVTATLFNQVASY